MGKQTKKAKNFCQKCTARHSAPTGARCTRGQNDEGVKQSAGPPDVRPRSPRTSTAVIHDASESDGAKGDEREEGRNQSVGDKLSGTDIILSRIAELRNESIAHRAADKAEMQKAINDLAARVDAPIIFSDDEDDMSSAGSGQAAARGQGDSRCGQAAVPGAGQRSTFAKPARRVKTFATRVSQEMVQAASDPIARLREDDVTAAQARAIINDSGDSSADLEGTNLRSGYYRTLNDSKLFDVPWPNDFVYRNNGRKVPFDSMTIPEFVIGYCHIVVSNIPVIPETEAALDHISYLSDVMGDTEGGEWETVRNSHRQILHMAEQGQLRWEDVAARDTHRGKQLLRADRAAALALTRPAVQQANSSSQSAGFKGTPCMLFQSGRCGFGGHHHTGGQQWSHICNTCLRVTGQRNPHPELFCKRKLSHDNRLAKQSGSA